MIYSNSLAGSTIRRFCAATLFLAAPLLGGCSPVCATVDTWTWATCYSGMHGDDSFAVRSELDTPPAAGHADAADLGRPLVKRFVREQNLPGLSIAVGFAGEIVWAEGFGWADIDEQRPVTPRTRFRIGETAIPMTATAVGLLLERGALDIDLPVRRYVPGFPEKSWPVTTKQLMGHIAGIRHPDDEEMLYRRLACERPLDALAIYGEDPLRFEPGTAFRYSSYGWSLVGAVVEAAAGEPFLAFMRSEVFDPLAMADTELDTPSDAGRDTTTFYWPFAARDTTTGIEYANNPNDTCLQGAGALLSTPSDLVRFGAALLDGQLLQPETLELLQTPLRLNSGASTGHGLGWAVQQIPIGTAAEMTTVYSHDAISAGGTATLLTVPGHDIVIAIAANVSYAQELPALAVRIADLFVAPEGP